MSAFRGRADLPLILAECPQVTPISDIAFLRFKPGHREADEG